LIPHPQARFLRGKRGCIPARELGMTVVSTWAGDSTMAILTSRFFWDKKIRIAILTFATFLALC
jgi:hypothetical protein